jgi:hypothetical protein
MGTTETERRPCSKQANLGAARAESDGAMLNVAFVRTADFESLAGGPYQSFVVGRRGTGKSALFLSLGAHFRARKDCVVVEVRPEEHRVKGLVAAVRNLLGHHVDYCGVRSLLRVLWQAVLVEHAIDAIRNQFGCVTEASDESPREWLKQDVLETALNLLKHGVPAAVADPDAAVYSLAEFARLSDRRELAQVLNNRFESRVIILIDGVDEGWTGNSIDSGVVGGLSAAAIDLREKETGTYPVLFLRDGMYRTLADLDPDFSRNIAGDTVRLQWDRESLFGLVTERLRELYGWEKTAKKTSIWNGFAKRELNNRTGFDDCLERTLYRPRDILELLNGALQIARRAEREEIIPDDVERAAREISNSRLKDLKTEYEKPLPGIREFVDGFAGRPVVDTLEAILHWLDEQAWSPEARSTFTKLGSSANVFHALYTTGFLGIEAAGKGFIFCHDGADVALEALPPRTRVAVHPCYSRALGLPSSGPGDLAIREYAEDEYDDAPSRADEVANILRERTTGHWALLGGIPMGAAGAQRFAEWVRRAIELLFMDDLVSVELHANGDATERRDLVASNEATRGLWRRLGTTYGSSLVYFEIKNYEDVSSSDYHQVAHYSGAQYGRLSFVVYRPPSRSTLNKNERSHVQSAMAAQRLLVMLPAQLLVTCLRKKYQDDSSSDAMQKFRDWVDNHERKWSGVRAGSRD